jgi:hypothetical protein
MRHRRADNVPSVRSAEPPRAPGQGLQAAGVAALVSKKRGRPSNNRLGQALRVEVLNLVRERYDDCGPTLAHEKLTDQHGVKLSIETLRRWSSP